jgi:opacity protein-like surface antigen
MIKSMFLTAALLAGTALTSTTASAEDGFYISGSVTATDLSHGINRNTGQMDSPSISSFSSDTDVGLRLGLGYKAHVSKDFFMAFEGFYSWENASTESLNGMLRSTLDLDASYGADLRLGYDVSDKFAVYALAGLTYLDFDNDTGYTFAPPMQELSETEGGFTYGFGAEIQLTDRYSVVGEYRITNDVGFTPNPDVVGGFVNDNQIDHGAFRLGVNFSF